MKKFTPYLVCFGIALLAIALVARVSKLGKIVTGQ